MATFEEKTVSTERIFEGRVINLRKDIVTVIGGRTAEREIIEHNGGVTIVGVTKEGKIPLVKQYRKPAEKVILELPAGKLEKGEDPLEGAKREFQEETGYIAEKIRPLTSFYCAIGYSNEVIHVYLAENLTKAATNFDEDEAIENVEYTVEELKAMVMDGTINDGKTIVGIMMVADLYK